MLSCFISLPFCRGLSTRPNKERRLIYCKRALHNRPLVQQGILLENNVEGPLALMGSENIAVRSWCRRERYRCTLPPYLSLRDVPKASHFDFVHDESSQDARDESGKLALLPYKKGSRFQRVEWCDTWSLTLRNDSRWAFLTRLFKWNNLLSANLQA